MNSTDIPQSNTFQSLKLVITDFVSVNHYLAYRVVNSKGRSMAMSYKTREATQFQKKFTEYVRQEVKNQGWVTDPNPMQHYYVDAIFYFPRIDMDVNNYWKVAFDAITDSGVVWVDDNMACERVMGVYYDTENPRIELTIHKTDFTGIFKNQIELEMFQNKCKKCTRNMEKCTLLRKAKEGRIQKEIHSGMCEKYKEKSA